MKNLLEQAFSHSTLIRAPLDEPLRVAGGNKVRKYPFRRVYAWTSLRTQPGDNRKLRVAPLWLYGRSAIDKTHTIVHEMTHASMGTVDHKYGVDDCSRLSYDKATENADSWALFILAAFGSLTLPLMTDDFVVYPTVLESPKFRQDELEESEEMPYKKLKAKYAQIHHEPHRLSGKTFTVRTVGDKLHQPVYCENLGGMAPGPRGLATYHGGYTERVSDTWNDAYRSRSNYHSSVFYWHFHTGKLEVGTLVDETIPVQPAEFDGESTDGHLRGTATYGVTPSGYSRIPGAYYVSQVTDKFVEITQDPTPAGCTTTRIVMGAGAGFGVSQANGKTGRAFVSLVEGECPIGKGHFLDNPRGPHPPPYPPGHRPPKPNYPPPTPSAAEYEEALRRRAEWERTH